MRRLATVGNVTYTNVKPTPALTPPHPQTDHLKPKWTPHKSGPTMLTDYPRLMGLAGNHRLPTRAYPNPIPGQIHTGNPMLTGRTNQNLTRSQRAGCQRSHSQSSTLPTQFCLHGRKENREQRPVTNLKGLSNSVKTTFNTGPNTQTTPVLLQFMWWGKTYQFVCLSFISGKVGRTSPREL